MAAEVTPGESTDTAPTSVAVTRFAGCGRSLALGLIVITIVAMAVCAWRGGTGKTESIAAATRPTSGKLLDDPAVMCLIAQRVHTGESYYQAAGTLLRANGYGVRSVFNWRQPLYAWFLGGLPSLRVGRVILVTFGAIAVLLAMRPLFADGPYGMAILHAWLISGAVFFCFAPWGIGSVDGWGAICILLSLFAYGEKYWLLGCALGLLALFFRELAGPYAAVCLLLAINGRRRNECIAWTVGLLGYGVYFAAHVVHVLHAVRPNDIGYDSGWVQFGGIHFVVETAAQSQILDLFPLWVAGLYLPPSLLGLVGMPGENGRRIGITVAIYTVAFAIVGKPFNDYWGTIDAPLLAFGLPWLIPGVRDLWRSAIARPTTEPV